MALTEDKRAELLLAHYKDTYDNILYHWKTRNLLFTFALILLSFMALDTYTPGLISQLVNDYLTKNLGNEKQPFKHIDFSAIGSAIWFVLLYIVIQYYQKSILVDRQYKYISNLEDQICVAMGGDYVTREGKAYLSKTGVSNNNEKRPFYLRAVGPLYTFAFPLMLTIIVVVKMLRENMCPTNVFDYFNILVGAAIVLYDIFYLTWVLRKK